jgi:hypothetical protein
MTRSAGDTVGSGSSSAIADSTLNFAAPLQDALSPEPLAWLPDSVGNEIGQYDLNPAYWLCSKNGVALIDEIENRAHHERDASRSKRHTVCKRIVKRSPHHRDPGFATDTNSILRASAKLLSKAFTE